MMVISMQSSHKLNTKRILIENTMWSVCMLQIRKMGSRRYRPISHLNLHLPKYDISKFQDAVLVENMHDVPYVQNEKIGVEIIAAMTRLCTEVKRISPKTPCGVQLLASGNCQALAIAKASNLQFIRSEGFIFSHIADEGFTDACAGQLLRYRKQIDSDDILIFTDLKKKHSSHAITADVSLLETVKAAEFFLTDGIILTGKLVLELFEPLGIISR